MKIAAIEAEWHTLKPPAKFTLFGIPDLKRHVTNDEISIPWVLGLIATRSTNKPVLGIFDLVAGNRVRIESGIEAYAALKELRANPGDPALRARFAAHQRDLGYGFLLLRYTQDPAAATPQQIDAAAWSTVPNVLVLFWSFRVMVAIGFFLIALFATAFYLASRHRFTENRWFLRVAFWSLPLPWIAAELGWIVAEYGRQPWAIDGVLPTFLGASPVPAAEVWLSLSGFMVFYSALAVVDVFLLRRMIRRGPDGLGFWPPAPSESPEPREPAAAAADAAR
jgi:cytochrome d ubiquinol oxidase subunit I